MRLRAEVAKAKKESAGQVDTHDTARQIHGHTLSMSISTRLGGHSTEERTASLRSQGCRTEGVGYVDYVLWGPTESPSVWWRRSARPSDRVSAQQQAKLYADCLEQHSASGP